MEQLMFSLNATIPIFLVMVLGYVIKRIGMVDEHFVKILNKLNYHITLPVLLFKDISESDFFHTWDSQYVLFCFGVSLLSISFIWIITSILFRDKDRQGEFVQASFRSSAAVLGIAFIQSIYGTSGMAPLMVIGTVPLYNVASVIILSFTGPDRHGLQKESIKEVLKDIATNPIILGILLGMVVSISRIQLPVMLKKSMGSIASLATPLALIALGAGFEGRKALKQIFPTIVASSIKLVLLPAVFLPLAIHMGFTGEKLVAILIMLGSPATVSCYIMAKNMGHKGVLTSSVVVTTTLLSSVTLTTFLFVLRWMALV